MTKTYENRAAAEAAIVNIPLEWIVMIHPIPNSEMVRVTIKPR